MFKQTFYTALLTTIFATTPIMAADQSTGNNTNHPAEKMEKSVDPRAAEEMEKHADKYDGRSERERLKGTETSQHPANEMAGSTAPRAAEEMEKHADKYDGRTERERLKDVETSQHPAHEMGESDELKARGN